MTSLSDDLMCQCLCVFLNALPCFLLLCTVYDVPLSHYVSFCRSLDNGFIPESLLEDVMKALDLVSEPEYVSLVKSKLDPENLGIILLGPFLLEFFPDQDSGIPDSFPIYHYNGLKQSNHKERVSHSFIWVFPSCNGGGSF
ncbi:hypothetical protein XENORESO_009789 [Xenotaenia resolanae]|uniref:Ubiquitinyl hydrolase 1 n=1 Tax=Xenotaenia resolanae TaxID=208358 RepID=A0ABV0X8M4_9TELE